MGIAITPGCVLGPGPHCPPGLAVTAAMAVPPGHGSASCPCPLAGGSCWHCPGVPPQLPVDVGMDHQEARPEDGMGLGMGMGRGMRSTRTAECERHGPGGAVQVPEAEPCGRAGRAQLVLLSGLSCVCSSSDVLHTWGVREDSGFLSLSKQGLIGTAFFLRTSPVSLGDG